MKMTAWRVYFDYEKEEKWLNEMSAKGFAFQNYCFFRYVFTACEPNEYIYRIELLEYLPGNPVSQKYIQFMAENGVEYVAGWARWAYFRKKTADGPFDIYSDIDSKIMHYKRIIALLLPIACFLMIMGIVNLNHSIEHISDTYHAYSSPFFILGIIQIILGFVILVPWNRTRLKLKKLKKEKLLVE